MFCTANGCFLIVTGTYCWVKAEPTGPACHTGARTCFFAEVTPQGVAATHGAEEANGSIFDRLYEMVRQRKAHPQEHSYVSSLMKDGPDRILKKIVEEAGEVVLAVKNGTPGRNHITRWRICSFTPSWPWDIVIFP